MFTSLSFGFLRGLEEGDSVLEVDLLTVDADLEGVVVAEVAIFWRACSSAMRESIAPLSRYEQISYLLTRLPRAGDCECLT